MWFNLLALFFVLAACSISAPVAEKIPHDVTLCNDKRIDEYYWMRERDNPKVIAHLEAENAYTKAMIAHTDKLREEMFQEMKARVKETDLSVPVFHGGYYYYQRDEAGKQYKVNCRKKGSLDAPEEILLDQNKLAEGHEYFSLGMFVVSPDHQLAAYSVDMKGDERYTLSVKEFASGKVYDDTIENAGDLVWANDNRTFYYSLVDDVFRPYKVFRHRLGKTEDELIHHETDERFWLSLKKTRSQRFVLLGAGTFTSSECHIIDANDPEAKARCFLPREENHEYEIEHHGDHLYIRTNLGAINFKLMRAPLGNWPKERWETVLPHRDDALLESVDFFEKYMVIHERANANQIMRVREIASGKDHAVQFPENVFSYSVAKNPEFGSTTFRVNYTSLVTPDSVFDYDIVNRKLELKKEQEIVGGYDRAKYTTERILGKAWDGAEVPISLVYRKDRFKKDGGNPCILDGYGSYGYANDPSFSNARLSLLDRGYVYALAHTRGGSDMGRQWYEDGKMMRKRNTFTDFIACAEKLIADKYTTNKKLGIWSGSAGGLLIGFCVNERPELFGAAVAAVPFVDVLTTMADETIPLTAAEWDQWGNPNKQEHYWYMKSYSPYDNVKKQAYPPMLVTAGLNDPRVMYWEPAKWVARMRAMKTDDNVLLFHVNMGAGHFGQSGRYGELMERALRFTFFVDHLGTR
ncbi:MAG: S9 family peptidase [Planctomycetaceae bacterium]|nr:S9 family peptidase [Planctomycetaceae bacterium]